MAGGVTASMAIDLRHCKKRDLGNNVVHVHMAAIRVKKIMVEYGSAALIIQAAHRDNAIESARAQKGHIQLSNIMGGTDQQILTEFRFKQWHLLKKFVGYRFFQLRGLIPAGGQLLEFVNKKNRLLKVAGSVHKPFQIGPQAILSVDQKRAGTQLDEPPFRQRWT
jgi:hypothetical protein